MDNRITTSTFFTFFTLLIFTASAARPAVDLPVTKSTARPAVDLLVTKPTTVREPETFTGSRILLPGHNVTSESNATASPITVNNNRVQPENTTNDLTNFTRLLTNKRPAKLNRRPNQLGRHRRPCRKHSQYRIDRTSRNNERIEKYEDKRSESFNAEAPTNWMKTEHYHAALRHRNHYNNQRKGNENVIKTKKHVFDKEKFKNLAREKDQKRRAEENGLMKNIRKFMKHTFD